MAIRAPHEKSCIGGSPEKSFSLNAVEPLLARGKKFNREKQE